ncbi:MAG: hypothetical protein QG597_2324 [Actinomycetota bacterium]|nr:hypothetical protein [Actinomycetota bacterium]
MKGTAMATDPTAMLQQLLGSASGAVDLSKIQGMIQPAMDMITQSGGLQGLLAKLQEGGLGEQVQSWLGQGPTLPVSPDQLTSALGPEQLKAAAEKAGVSAQELAGGMSTLLPGLVSGLSSGGSLPGVGNVSELAAKLPGGEQLTGLLGSLLGGASGTPTPPAE